MADPEYAMNENGFLVPPALDGQPHPAAWPQASGPVYVPASYPRPGMPLRRRDPAPLPRAGRLNWIFGVLGIVTGLASFVWPLLCVTVLVSLALSAVGLSRFNRLRRRGANGRAIAVAGLVIGLASAANLVFGISQMVQLGSMVSRVLP